MTVTQPAIVAITQSISQSKMEDRKRSLAADVEDLAPSRKRIAKDENGSHFRLEGDKEKEIENFQKDAIHRQMKAERREKKYYEELYNDLNRKITHHDDHLRAVDAWFAQLLDELRILAADSLPPPQAIPVTTNERASFANQLQTHSSKVKAAIAEIFTRIPNATPEIRALQEQITTMLAQEKLIRAECEKLNTEKSTLSEQMETAVWRYMKAEKALDRAKSAQIAKLERQLIAGGNAPSPTVETKAATPVKREHSDTNGDIENGVDASEAETARREAVAIADARKRQLDEIEAENERLTNALSAARTKVASLANEDYAETALFKTAKAQFEDVITKINDLESTNIHLREEAQKLQSERTSYRSQVDEEARAQISEAEAHIAKCEVDLARIRNARDETFSELNIRKAAEDNRRTAADQARELAEARDKKIISLESELARIKVQLGDQSATTSSEELNALSVDELKIRLQNLEQQHQLLGQELPSIEDAWRKAQAIASRKVADVAEAEEKLSRLSAEKVKADQKYFATMKAKDSREGELRVLKAKDARSSEIVTQLKEADARSRELLTAQDRQLVEMKDVLASTERQFRAAEQKHVEAQTQFAGLRKQVEEFKSMIGSKDEEMLSLKKSKREIESALEGTTARLEDTKKHFETMRKARASQSSTDSGEETGLRSDTAIHINPSKTVINVAPGSQTPLLAFRIGTLTVEYREEPETGGM
ncbi:hypothetical protein MRB53_037961 [Persea americana]|nr:hypothetical protein MRB53_037961 [Persea americana]